MFVKIKKVKFVSCFVLLVLMFALSACTVPPVEPSGPSVPPSIEDPSSLDIEFVEDVSAFTDPSKQYVLPDGYLYRCKRSVIYASKNQLETATDTDGSLYNRMGYLDQARIRSVLVIAEANDSFVTGFIPVRAGDTVYFSGDAFDPGYKNAHVMNTAFYNAKREAISRVTMQDAFAEHFELLEENEDGYASAIRIREDALGGQLAYIRFTLIGSGAGQMIGINESFDKWHEELAWEKSEPYIPSHWFAEIKNTVDKVKGLELVDETKTVSFMLSSDIHLAPSPFLSYTQDLGKVSSAVMQACKIPYYLDAGDSCTQSAAYMPSDFARNIAEVLEQLAPIPRKNLLMALGNHDGATGITDGEDGEKQHYRFQLSNEERSRVFFDWQRESNPYKCFDSDGTYYYLDDPTTQTRYIVLNSFWSQWAGDADGYVSDVQHSFFQTPLFGQQQLRWFADRALNMPSGYAAVVLVHQASCAGDFAVFKGIVDAFSAKTEYSGEHIGVQDWQSSQISVNYQNANGEIIAFFQGHDHRAVEYELFESVPCINVTTTGAYWDVREEDAEERVLGTSSEFAVEVVVIDRQARRIYLTRLGAGEDRIIEY